MNRILNTRWALLIASLLLGACGGGGGGGGGTASTGNGSGSGGGASTPSDFDQGVFRASSVYSAQCLNPRGTGFPDRSGTAEDENNWLRAWSHDLYLWYDEIIDEDPAEFDTPSYFELMKTFETTASGSPKDKFHFTYDSEQWQKLSQSGILAGYGMELAVVSARPPREILIAFVEANSPAEQAGLARGDRILVADGVNVENDGSEAGVATINAALSPEGVGESHTFEVVNFDRSNPRTVTLTSAEFEEDPVPLHIASLPLPTGSSAGPVGYILFHAHIAPAEQALLNAIQTLAAANVTELVLDLRYNGGGFLDIANELSFMIAGPAATQGTYFERMEFNDKHPSVNPVTGASLSPVPFHETAQGFSVANGTPLPSLSLNRVFVLSGPGTCSASESIVNGLQGIGFEVILIGQPTCGKPYGFYPQDNCGTTYFSVQFRGTNNAGFGDYADGFVPSETPSLPAEVAGCNIADDFSRPLGDVSEAMLAGALNYIDSGSCPDPGASTTALRKISSLTSSGPAVRIPDRMPGRIQKSD